VRQGDQWVLTELSSLEESLMLDTLNVQISLADIYERIELAVAGHPTAPVDAPSTPGPSS
jgi:hypothetical protein